VLNILRFIAIFDSDMCACQAINNPVAEDVSCSGNRSSTEQALAGIVRHR
jgi:hypothetical protein